MSTRCPASTHGAEVIRAATRDRICRGVVGAHLVAMVAVRIRCQRGAIVVLAHELVADYSRGCDRRSGNDYRRGRSIISPEAGNYIAKVFSTATVPERQ